MLVNIVYSFSYARQLLRVDLWTVHSEQWTAAAAGEQSGAGTDTFR